MALALLTLDQRDGDRYAFRADLGDNRYYRYTVGRPAAADEDGFPVLRNTRFRSELFGPVTDPALGRVRFDVPAGLFDRDFDTVQLWSYRTPGGDGAVASRPLRVPLSAPQEPGRPAGLSVGRPRPADAPLRFRDGRVSDAMVLPALAALIPLVAQALPAILPVVTKLLDGGPNPFVPGAAPAAPAGGGAGVDPTTLASLVAKLGADPSTLQLLGQLLSQMSATDAVRVVSPEPGPDRATPPGTATPAPTDLVPALITVLKQVASPEAVAAACRSLPPPKVLGLLVEGLHQWLAAFNPAAPPTAVAQSVGPRRRLPAALRHLGSSFAAEAGRLPYRRVPAVRLSMGAIPTPTLGGRPQVIVGAGTPAIFRLRLDTPKPVPGGTLTLVGKHPVTLARLFAKRVAVAGGPGGPLDPAPVLEPGDLAAVPPGEEFLLTTTLAWVGKGGKRFGTSLTLLARKGAPYLFDRIGAGGPTAALSDPQLNRDFWHKVWEASLDRQVRRYSLDVTYTYALAADRPGAARPATVWSAEPQGPAGALVGRAESGLEVSPAALNRLLPVVGAGEPWPADRLAALGGSEFAAEAHRRARRRVEFGGRPGDTVALWVYPEVQAHDVVLAQPGEVTADGFVANLAPVAAPFPLPVAAHLVGVRTV